MDGRLAWARSSVGSVSTVGKKAIMAASGVVLVGFVVVHMLANLQIFGGRARLDGYARSLREAPVLLWSVRALLAAAFVAHVGVGAQLAARKRAARPVAARVGAGLLGRPLARTMLWTGGLLGAFVVVHLANLTWGVWHPRFVPLAPYENVVALLRSAPASAFYLAAALALGLHVAHGGASLFLSLGLASARRERALRVAARALAAVVAGGLAAAVVAVVVGAVR
jgi:succinate dehydrogenase / fumarate reductase cytochrome b subunit